MHCYGVALVQRNVSQWTEAKHIFPKAGKALLSLKSPRTVKDLRLMWNSIDTQGQMEGHFFHLNVFQGFTESKDSWVASAHERSIAKIAVDGVNKHGRYLWVLTKLSSYSQFFLSLEKLGKPQLSFCKRKLTEVFQFLEGNINEGNPLNQSISISHVFKIFLTKGIYSRHWISGNPLTWIKKSSKFKKQQVKGNTAM